MMMMMMMVITVIYVANAAPTDGDANAKENVI